MKTIIVPTDFSPVAINAMNYAIEMALAIDASISLLHVYQLPVSYNTTTELEFPVVDIQEMEKINIERLDKLKTQIDHVASGKIKIDTIVKLGDFVDELAGCCAEINPFAVIMGSSGSGFVERLLVGSSALAAIKQLTWPVIVVPAGAVFKGIERMGFACDFKKVIETTPVHYIKEWVKTFNAGLKVLNVDQEKKHDTPQKPGEYELLQVLLEEIDPSYFFISNPEVGKAIHDFAEVNNLDLLIVIPKKHGLIESLFQKDHTAELIFLSHIPILAIHEKEE